MKHNHDRKERSTTMIVKNPHWSEASLLAIYKYSWKIEPGTTRNKFHQWSEHVLNTGSTDLKASVLPTGPHCLLKLTERHLSITPEHLAIVNSRRDLQAVSMLTSQPLYKKGSEGKINKKRRSNPAFFSSKELGHCVSQWIMQVITYLACKLLIPKP